MSYNYYLKYIKYKNKYLKYKKNNLNQKGGSNRVEKRYIKQYDNIMDKLLKNNITTELALEISNFIKEYVTIYYDPEDIHILEDKLMSKFVSELAIGNLIDLDNIKDIALIIKKINDQNYLKWYS